jgi:hypothetical protein
MMHTAKLLQMLCCSSGQNSQMNWDHLRSICDGKRQRMNMEVSVAAIPLSAADSYNATCTCKSYFHTPRDMIIWYLCSWQTPVLLSLPQGWEALL